MKKGIRKDAPFANIFTKTKTLTIPSGFTPLGGENAYKWRKIQTRSQTFGYKQKSTRL